MSRHVMYLFWETGKKKKRTDPIVQLSSSTVLKSSVMND